MRHLEEKLRLETSRLAFSIALFTRRRRKIAKPIFPCQNPIYMKKSTLIKEGKKKIKGFKIKNEKQTLEMKREKKEKKDG